MSTALFPSGLIDRLPAVSGKLIENAPLRDYSWFRVGGPAEILFQPTDSNDLSHFLQSCPQDIPLTILGAGSNLLIRDGGVPGVVIKLGPRFASLETIDETTIRVGAAAMDLNVARFAQKAGLSGFEFLCGIPGTIGGALRMNAGAHGGEMKNIVLSVVALNRKGEQQTLSAADMGFSYRKTALPSDYILLQAVLRGQKGNPEAIEARMKEISASRNDSQPIRERTCGSTFANPEGAKAWQLIDKAGCRGLRIGGAMISEQHCNFMINTGDATATDLESLGEEVRRRVRETSGIDLRWEIQRVGLYPHEQTKNKENG